MSVWFVCGRGPARRVCREFRHEAEAAPPSRGPSLRCWPVRSSALLGARLRANPPLRGPATATSGWRVPSARGNRTHQTGGYSYSRRPHHQRGDTTPTFRNIEFNSYRPCSATTKMKLSLENSVSSAPQHRGSVSSDSGMTDLPSLEEHNYVIVYARVPPPRAHFKDCP